MSNKEILEKAIQKAIDNGWKMPKQFEVSHLLSVGFRSEPEGISQYQGWVYNSYTDVIYNHDFARALWGESRMAYELNGRDIYEWEYRLAEMVIANDPIKYLGNNQESKEV